MLAEHVGTELDGCAWVGIAFAGGMCEAARIGARSLLINDRHRHVMNLAAVTAHRVLGPTLYRRLKRLPFHPDVLASAQDRLRAREQRFDDDDGLFAAGSRLGGPDVEWAVDYFVAAWMARNGTAGTGKEFQAGMSIRYDAGGGDSATRFRSATASLVAWRQVLGRANFTTLDAFEFIDGKVKDADGLGLYCDPPFPGPGDAYKHTFGVDGQRRLAASVGRFKATRVVMRFYRHPLVEELYPRDRWTWVERTGRKQTNGDAPEVLIINGVSKSAGVAA